MSARRLWKAFLVIKGNDTKFIHKQATEGSSILPYVIPSCDKIPTRDAPGPVSSILDKITPGSDDFRAYR